MVGDGEIVLGSLQVSLLLPVLGSKQEYLGSPLYEIGTRERKRRRERVRKSERGSERECEGVGGREGLRGSERE